MHERIGPAIGDMNRAMHEVRLDGPGKVSAATDHLRSRARRVQALLKALIGDGGPGQWDAYDADDTVLAAFGKVRNRAVI
ncbi:hypothetical protein SAMN04489712_1487 [Thermomonospora echinospora]|uniref:Uncharacterized protein n=1 Tax=Thermomonospora echinospora TaxID=1992 RepID=A0A1H6E9J8_9ACTN|nr:hypothetical protein [Thermomonospora echinospora]SEG94498.1 hypothetical protein SAMN04489712_1487 [Thermomonospora echinospora]